MRHTSLVEHKHLEYALRAVKLDLASTDSLGAGVDYFNLAEAFRFSGFFTEAGHYMEKSLEHGLLEGFYTNEKAELVSDTSANFAHTHKLMEEHQRMVQHRQSVFHPM